MSKQSDEDQTGFDYITPVVADDWPGNSVKELSVDTNIPEVLYNNNEQPLEERFTEYSNGVKNGQVFRAFDQPPLYVLFFFKKKKKGKTDIEPWFSACD